MKTKPRFSELAFPTTNINWTTHRLVLSRFPPIQLFEWAENEEEAFLIAELEGLTSERLRSECGDISLVSPKDRVWGEGSTPLMAAFTYPGPSRFSDGTFGIYYAAKSIETAIAETRYHRARFLKASNEPPCVIQYREYTATVKEPLIDLRDPAFQQYASPDLSSYLLTQPLGKHLRERNAWGVIFPSARDEEGICIGAFRPNAMSKPVPARHYNYIWDGNEISDIRLSTSVKLISLDV